MTDDPRAGQMPLVAGALALDFANTASGRGTPTHRNHLTSALDVLAWAAHAGAIDAVQHASLLAARNEPDLAGLHGEALVLRELIFRIITALSQSEDPNPADLEHLTSYGAQAIATARLERNPEGTFRWSWHDTATIWTVLGPIVLSAIGLLRDGDPKRIKSCATGEPCGWLFFDMTKNASRRWCEMSVCGNRAKQKRVRQRRPIPPAEAV